MSSSESPKLAIPRVKSYAYRVKDFPLNSDFIIRVHLAYALALGHLKYGASQHIELWANFIEINQKRFNIINWVKIACAKKCLKIKHFFTHLIMTLDILRITLMTF